LFSDTCIVRVVGKLIFFVSLISVLHAGHAYGDEPEVQKKKVIFFVPDYDQFAFHESVNEGQKAFKTLGYENSELYIGASKYNMGVKKFDQFADKNIHRNPGKKKIY